MTPTLNTELSQFEKLSVQEIHTLLQLNSVKAAHAISELVLGCACGSCIPVHVKEVIDDFSEIDGLLKRSHLLLVAMSLRRAHTAGGSEAVDQVFEIAVPI